MLLLQNTKCHMDIKGWSWCILHWKWHWTVKFCFLFDVICVCILFCITFLWTSPISNCTIITEQRNSKLVDFTYLINSW